MTKKDPILAAIDAHRTSMRELNQGIKAPPGRDPSDKTVDKYLAREGRARDVVMETTPKTLQGLLALVSHVAAAGNRGDNTFEDVLLDVIETAEKVLAKQLGVAA